MPSFHLHPLVARWLRAEAPESNPGEPPDWNTWLLQRMSRGEVLEVGGVLVDRAVLRQRFACVSERCAPGPDRVRSQPALLAAKRRGRVWGPYQGPHLDRGNCRSCCADTFVPLSRAEDRRLGSRGVELLGWMKAREPRLIQRQGRAFYREKGELGLARPGGRCVFSRLDDRGRIRCHLHAYAKQARIARGELQPVSCRLFPLIVVARGAGRAVLTVVAPHTRRLVGAYPAKRYPCLSDASLPPLLEAMRGDLDWLFGKGFAKALARTA
jgi:hypothetical protein